MARHTEAEGMDGDRDGGGGGGGRCRGAEVGLKAWGKERKTGIGGILGL